jgi:hypothetical protein
MSKRRFRPEKHVRPGYPTLGSFQRTRRDFLLGLGASLLSAGTLAALAGCDGRAVLAGADGTTTPADGSKPDGPVMMGARREPDAKVDRQTDSWREPDAGPPDSGAPDVEPFPSPGYAPPMDALIDDGGSSSNP